MKDSSQKSSTLLTDDNEGIRNLLLESRQVFYIKAENLEPPETFCISVGVGSHSDLI